MENRQIEALTDTFEGHAQKTGNGIEYWLARDLQALLGYAEWRNSLKLIGKAETACELSGHQIGDHFVDVNKMVDLGSGAQREAVLQTLLNRGIRPESLPSAEDVKKAERRLSSDTKKSLQNPDRLGDA